MEKSKCTNSSGITRRDAWRLQKPGLFGPKFITLVASLDAKAIKNALEAALGRAVANVNLM